MRPFVFCILLLSISLTSYSANAGREESSRLQIATYDYVDRVLNYFVSGVVLDPSRSGLGTWKTKLAGPSREVGFDYTTDTTRFQLVFSPAQHDIIVEGDIIRMANLMSLDQVYKTSDMLIPIENISQVESAKLVIKVSPPAQSELHYELDLNVEELVLLNKPQRRMSFGGGPLPSYVTPSALLDFSPGDREAIEELLRSKEHNPRNSDIRMQLLMWGENNKLVTLEFPHNTLKASFNLNFGATKFGNLAQKARKLRNRLQNKRKASPIITTNQDPIRQLIFRTSNIGQSFGCRRLFL